MDQYPIYIIISKMNQELMRKLRERREAQGIQPEQKEQKVQEKKPESPKHNSEFEDRKKKLQAFFNKQSGGGSSAVTNPPPPKEQIKGNANNFNNAKKLLQQNFSKPGGGGGGSSLPPPPPPPGLSNLPPPPPPPKIDLPTVNLSNLPPPPPPPSINTQTNLKPPPSLPTQKTNLSPPPPPPTQTKTETKSNVLPPPPPPPTQTKTEIKSNVLPPPPPPPNQTRTETNVLPPPPPPPNQTKTNILPPPPPPPNQTKTETRTTNVPHTQNIPQPPPQQNQGLVVSQGRQKSEKRDTFKKSRPGIFNSQRIPNISAQFFDKDVAAFVKREFIRQTDIIGVIGTRVNKKLYNFNFPSIQHRLRDIEPIQTLYADSAVLDVVSCYMQKNMNAIKPHEEARESFKEAFSNYNWNSDTKKLKSIKDLANDVPEIKYREPNFVQIKNGLNRCDNLIRSFVKYENFTACAQVKKIREETDKMIETYCKNPEGNDALYDEIERKIQQIKDTKM